MSTTTSSTETSTSITLPNASSSSIGSDAASKTPVTSQPSGSVSGSGDVREAGIEGNETKETGGKRPVAAIVIGMAGSGKTTLMQQLGSLYGDKEDEEEREKAYFINLDPAVSTNEELPYFAHIDIRDTVKYKEVMKQYGLGPNGGIVTSLNLFATRFDQVLGICEKRAVTNQLDYIFIDTPGQIEVFTWSASGSIITESLANSFPTCVLYVVDTPRNLSPVTFMSNMLYACSIMYKTKLPFFLVFNKTDVASADVLHTWMKDIDAFTDALSQRGPNGESEAYVSTLSRSMSLVLTEFYENLKYVSVSAATGDGMDDLFKAIEASREDFTKIYLPLMEKRRKARAKMERRHAKEKQEKIRKDMERTAGLKPVETGENVFGKQSGKKTKKPAEDDEEEEVEGKHGGREGDDDEEEDDPHDIMRADLPKHNRLGGHDAGTHAGGDDDEDEDDEESAETFSSMMMKLQSMGITPEK